jgi:hypothetical protein
LKPNAHKLSCEPIQPPRAWTCRASPSAKPLARSARQLQRSVRPRSAGFALMPLGHPSFALQPLGTVPQVQQLGHRFDLRLRGVGLAEGGLEEPEFGDNLVDGGQ